ncbi:hypothetical protein CYMTET_33743, partial [Cymbomonas tetramitiformis]
EKAIEVYQDMKDSGIRPSCVTFDCILRVCEQCGKSNFVAQVHKDMQMANVELDDVAYSTAIRAYESVGEWEWATDVYNEMMGQVAAASDARGYDDASSDQYDYLY